MSDLGHMRGQQPGQQFAPRIRLASGTRSGSGALLQCRAITLPPRFRILNDGQRRANPWEPDP